MIAVRHLPGILLALLLATCVVLLVAVRLAPVVDARLLAVRGGSMEPSIAVGSLFVVVGSPPERLAVGDVVAVELPSGVVVTHRIRRVLDGGEGRWFELAGDANRSSDPMLAPATDVVGRAALVLPLLGYLLVMLSMPTGIAALASLAVALAVAGRILGDDRERHPPASRRRRRAPRAAALALVGIGLIGMDAGGTDAALTLALATDQEATSGTVTADTLDPPGNLVCNGGTLSCSASLVERPQLSWTASPDSYATGYRILRSTTSGTGYVQVGAVGAGTTTFTDTSPELVVLTTYYYVVVTVTPSWTSGPSNEVDVGIIV